MLTEVYTTQSVRKEAVLCCSVASAKSGDYLLARTVLTASHSQKVAQVKRKRGPSVAQLNYVDLTGAIVLLNKSLVSCI